MKNIAVYFDKPNHEDYPFNDKEYRTAYRELAQTVTEKGAQFAVVRSKKSYLGGKTYLVTQSATLSFS
jgi:hypothetical protein